jgi:hypothetical protein
MHFVDLGVGINAGDILAMIHGSISTTWMMWN